RETLGPGRLVGLSTHTPEQVDAAGAADYIGVGPVAATPTKPGREPVGLELVAHAAARSPVPFFAIGGIRAALARPVGAARSRRRSPSGTSCSTRRASTSATPGTPRSAASSSSPR